MTQNNFNAASKASRFLGGLIDLILLLIFTFAFGYFTNLATMTNEGYSLSGLPFLFTLFVCFLLFAIMEFFTGRTPGKYCVGIKVISEDGKKISLMQAMIRNIARFVDGVGFYIFGFIVLSFTKDRQRLGDLMAKTYVINIK